MKKLCVLLTALLLALSSCNTAKDTGGIEVIDYSNAVITSEQKTAKVTLSDGTNSISTMNIPKLNVDLDGANSLSEKMSNDLKEAYGSYFDSPDTRLLTVDYSYEEKNDIIAVLISSQLRSPDSSVTQTRVYYYDALADTELDLIEYVNFCGAQLSQLYGKLLESEWAQNYKNQTGNLPHDSVISAAVYKGSNSFDVYVRDTNETSDTLLTLTVDASELTLPEFQ